jgi:trehalose 6-phosphate phosphatase
MGTINISPGAIQAVIFDMDGVVTKTATVHAAAWKRLFHEFLRERCRSSEASEERRFDLDSDYRLYVDGPGGHRLAHRGRGAGAAGGRGADLPAGRG